MNIREGSTGAMGHMSMKMNGRTGLRSLSILAGLGFLAGCTTMGGSATTSFAPSTSGKAAVGMVNGLAARPGAGLKASGDQMIALSAEYRALEYKQQGEAVSWQSENGVSGRVVAFQPYRVGRQDCRQYTHTLTLGDEVTTLKGAACRTENGGWMVI